MKMKRTIVIGIIFLALFPGAQASLFDDLRNILAPAQTPAISQPANDFNAFMARMYKLNTPEAIQSLNAEMEDYGVNNLKVTVSGIPGEHSTKSLFVVKGLGILTEAQKQNALDNHITSQIWGFSPKDKEVALTYSQMIRMYPYFEAGKLDFFDRWQLFAIYKMG